MLGRKFIYLEKKTILEIGNEKLGISFIKYIYKYIEVLIHSFGLVM